MSLALGIANALAHLHSKRIVHGGETNGAFLDPLPSGQLRCVKIHAAHRTFDD